MEPNATLDAVADPNRRRILDALREDELSVNDLVEVVGLSQPAVSKHLKVLRAAGLVSVRPDGQRRMYRVDVLPLVQLDEWLEPYRQMWADSLERLERHLDQPAKNSQQARTHKKE